MQDQICVLNEKNNNFFSFDNEGFSELLKYHNNIIMINSWIGDAFLPLSIFDDSSLSALEAITKYMKEEIGLRYREIAHILNRDERTIWGAYSSSRKKMAQRFVEGNTGLYVPISILRDRSLSVLESITEYLRDELGLRYCKVASLLNRDDRTVWTVYQRAKRKRRRMKHEKNVQQF
ncbi:hypothetical protein KY366_00990 [Candidatus Woesearchaeota archaeon]|nr:hypothetical protein [Candidatus Woesearchaeota archaeon]